MVGPQLHGEEKGQGHHKPAHPAKPDRQSCPQDFPENFHEIQISEKFFPPPKIPLSKARLPVVSAGFSFTNQCQIFVRSSLGRHMFDILFMKTIWFIVFLNDCSVLYFVKS